MFTGESAMEHAEVDVNDPDFWKKVLPDLVRPKMSLRQQTSLLLHGLCLSYGFFKSFTPI